MMGFDNHFVSVTGGKGWVKSKKFKLKKGKKHYINFSQMVYNIPYQICVKKVK